MGSNPLVGEVISGCFETEILPLATKIQGSNIFCYIDPFGVKVLDSSILDRFLGLKFDTVEMFINFNSFGFFRWACAYERIQIDRETNMKYSDFDDEEPAVDATEESLNSVLGSSDWKAVIAEYNRTKDNDKDAGKKAVDSIAFLYRRLLKKKFKYVLNIRISVRKSEKAEYHMFFVTQHKDGAILMGDSMGKRECSMKRLRQGNQPELFEFEPVEDKNDPFKVIDDVLDIMRKAEIKKIRLRNFEAIAYTYMKRYISESDIKSYLKDLEKEGRIKVERSPENTPSTGKKSAFWDDCKGKALWIVL